jgi:hypothetical protein
MLGRKGVQSRRRKADNIGEAENGGNALNLFTSCDEVSSNSCIWNEVVTRFTVRDSLFPGFATASIPERTVHSRMSFRYRIASNGL